MSVAGLLQTGYRGSVQTLQSAYFFLERLSGRRSCPGPFLNRVTHKQSWLLRVMKAF